MKKHIPIPGFILLLCVALLGMYTPAHSQTHTARTINVNANCGGFYEYLPAGYAASSSQYPVIIAFHGAGSYGNGTASNLTKVLREQVAFYINKGTFPTSFTVGGQTSSFIVISPQLKAAATPADINGIITYVLNNYKVDRGRVYLSGYSMGGNHVFKYAAGSLANAQQVTAITTMAIYNYPYSDAGSQYLAQAEVSLWALHSSSDQTAPSTMSSNMVNKINSYNPAKPAIIRMVSGLSHVQSDTAFCNPNFRYNGLNIYEWFLTKRRNFPPTANAGSDVVLNLPGNSTTLNGSGSTDPENATLTYQWTKISGPSVFSMGSATSANTSLSNLIAGTYRFELLVTDNYAITDRDTVEVTVVNPLPNVLPVANAGNNQTITLPVNSVTLSGALSSDEGGAIETYSWQKVSGLDGVQIASPNSANTQVTFTKKGNYIFSLTVTDNEGGTTTANVQITVINPFANQAPVAMAGSNIEVTLPTNTANLNATSSADPDGEILQYAWSVLYGPTGAVIVNPQQPATTVGNLNTGTYGFRLQVTDDNGAIGWDTVEVKVNPLQQIIYRNLKVNVYGGSNPYNVDRWNNWNIGTGSVSNVASSAFIYEDDGTTSGITGLLSLSHGIGDNGASYGGTMCPPPVLRYTSYSTSQRTLTIRGLNNSNKYNLQFFASRATTGNSSSFKIGATTKSVVSDNNKSNKVEFVDLLPSNGQIVITISKTGSYSYLNGFIITEQAPDLSINGLPVAVASADSQAIRVPSNTVQLSSIGSIDADGSIVSYAWTKVAGPTSFTLANPFSANTSVGNLVEGNYQFELKVTDNRGGFALDTVAIEVLPPLQQAPRAVATSVPMVMLPSQSIELNGSTSNDPNGTIVAYQWRQVSGTTVGLTNAQSAIATAEFLVPGSFAFELEVLDNEGLTATDTVSFKVLPNMYEEPPVTDSLNCGQQVKLVIIGSGNADGEGASPKDSSWAKKLEGYIRSKNAGSSIVNFTSPDFNSYQVLNPTGYIPMGGRPLPNAEFNITKALSLNPNGIIISLSENDFDLGFSLLEQQANFQRALAEAQLRNIPVWITSPQPELNASAEKSNQLLQMKQWIESVAANKAIDFWSTVANAQGEMDSLYSYNARFVNNYGHHLYYSRVVGHQILDSICNRPLPNMPPTVWAGKDTAFKLPTDAYTFATSVSDPESSIALLQWSQLSGPTAAQFDNVQIADASISGLIAGIYTFQLQVFDNFGANAKDTIVVAVLPPNMAPVANAGADMEIFQPTSVVNLNGTASADADGTVVQYYWEMVSGQVGAVIESSNQPTTIASGLTLGTYTFQLTVTDNEGLQASDQVIVVVHEEPVIPNVPPVVNAGNDVQINLPVSTVQLSAMATDTDGSIQSISWQQTLGPNAAIFSNPNIAAPTVSGLVLGTYVFKVIVTDDDGDATADSLAVQVNPRPNTAPVVSAGANATIMLPINTVQLNGSATDAEDNIATYAWSRISGPANFSLVNPSQPITSVNGLEAGTYVFRLTVTDSVGATGFSDVAITVQPEAPPIVRQRILIDFGQTSTQTGASTPDQFGKYWNNVTDARPGIRLTNAKDSANGATTVGFEVTNRIDGTFSPSGNGINTGNSTTAVGDYPGSAVEDNAYAHNSTTIGKWRVFGLDPARLYTFKFWGTRSASGVRILQIKDSRASTWVEEFDAINNNNYNKAAFIRNISGVTEVSFDIRCKSGSTYGDISVLDITSEAAPITYITSAQQNNTVSATASVVNANRQQPVKPGELLVFPNPVKDMAYLQFSNSYKGTFQVQVVNAMGMVVARYSFNKAQQVFESRISLPQLPLGKYQVLVMGINFRLTQAMMRY